ncbi:MAG TPA: LPXTG cell wall anchor domain-containing protein [Solirubrobacteraceae bacterium]|nr:LPXTG cell wall anchor domain-containing protein [Solirubrobacteraceae bacterium]
MPSPRRAATLLAVLLGLALPAGAGAQSPGDEQYQDPFGGQQPQEEPAATPEPTPAPTAAPAPDPAQEPAPTATAQPASEPAPTAPSGGSGGDGELPRTGAPTGLVAAAGAAMLAGGLVLRRRAGGAGR